MSNLEKQIKRRIKNLKEVTAPALQDIKNQAIDELEWVLYLIKKEQGQCH